MTASVRGVSKASESTECVEREAWDMWLSMRERETEEHYQWKVIDETSVQDGLYKCNVPLVGERCEIEVGGIVKKA